MMNITVRVTKIGEGDLAALRAAIKELGITATESGRQVATFSQSLDKALTSMNAFGRNLSSLGRSMTYLFTIP